jgi:hypothetical protein
MLLEAKTDNDPIKIKQLKMNANDFTNLIIQTTTLASNSTVWVLISKQYMYKYAIVFIIMNNWCKI